MAIHTIELARARLTRIGYLDVPVPAGLVGLTPDEIARVRWSGPEWSSGDQVLLGAAAWVAELDGRRVVIDPLQTLDVLLRPDPASERAHQDAVERLFAEAGFPVETIDLAVLTHMDGVGMIARRDEAGHWAPFFPNARALLSDVELASFRSQGPELGQPDLVREAWTALLDAGCVRSYSDGASVASGLVAEVSGGHGAGHAVLHVRAGEQTALSFIGHLAVSPLHLATGECAALNEDPAKAWRILHEVARDGRLLAGSLWPTPGYGRWVDGGLRVSGAST